MREGVLALLAPLLITRFVTGESAVLFLLYSNSIKISKPFL